MANEVALQQLQTATETLIAQVGQLVQNTGGKIDVIVQNAQDSTAARDQTVPASVAAVAARDQVIPIAADVDAKHQEVLVKYQAVLESASAAQTSSAAAESAKNAFYSLTNIAGSYAEGLGYSASTTGTTAFFAVAAGGIGPDGATALTQTTCYRRTSVSTAVAFSVVVDGTSYAIGAAPFALMLKALKNPLLTVGHDGEIYPTRLDGRSIQSAVLDIEAQISPRMANPAIWTLWAPADTSGQKVQVVRVDADGAVMIPHTGGLPLQDWVKTAVESVTKTNTSDGIAVRIKFGSNLLGYMRDDGGLYLSQLGDRSVQDTIGDIKTSLAKASKLTLDADVFTLGDATPALVIRDPNTGAYASQTADNQSTVSPVLYVAIPSVARTGSRLWSAYTANKSVSVNSGEEPGSYCVLRYSDDEGLTWNIALYVAHPTPSAGRTADPTLIVRSGVLYLYYFQSGNSVAYDEAISTWQIACSNPQAHPRRAVWSTPVRVQYGFFVTTSFRHNEREIMPLVVIPDNLANANVTKQHLSLDRGTNLYQVWGRSFTKVGRIPFDLPVSNRSWAETSVQPCPDSSLLALIRYSDGLYFQRSTDGGQTWGVKSIITTATNIDATTSSKGSLTITNSGRLCLVWNNSTSRSNITIALSEDGGYTWPFKLLLDNRDNISYPNVTHDADTIHVVYDRDRMAVKRIYHIALSESAIANGSQTVIIHPVNSD